jgi:SOS-response transcriptional repressor LexA
VSETFFLRLRTDRLAPDYQDGDALEVEPADAAGVGELVVTAGVDYEARVDRYDGSQTVIGRVKHMYRRLGDV